MKVLVVGASRGVGAEVVRTLAARGHQVTAYARSGGPAVDGVTRVQGDVLDGWTLDKAMVGQEAVVVTLGISDNPVRVRLTGRAGTPTDVRSAGTRRVLTAMTELGVPRLVVQSTYGIGETYSRLSPLLRMFFSLVLRRQVDDHAVQEELVRTSSTDWTIVRPVALDDRDDDTAASVRTDDTVRGMHVGRRQVAAAVADALLDPSSCGAVLSVSRA